MPYVDIKPINCYLEATMLNIFFKGKVIVSSHHVIKIAIKESNDSKRCFGMPRYYQWNARSILKTIPVELNEY